MPTLKRISVGWTTIMSDSSGGIFLPATGWVQSAQVEKVRATVEFEGRTSTVLQVQPAYQTANVENAPSTPGTINSNITTTGVSYPSGFTTVATFTDDKQLIRFGFMVKSTDDSLQMGRATAVFELQITT